ncbi:TonB-dependent siderophore receptor [Acinetobacter sp. Colony158]|uniref:TonB-dependent siderophore receptor n=1 Tax=Acinetobacter sp. Colony158 TaxID=2810070 RepID=UPI001C4C5ABB|nr:TonB-dependent siderophore receptor [Acinetobacter sp. Colony158]
MTTSNPLLFKLSLITLAIFQVHLAHAEDTTLPVIELQADASGNQSSEQTKSYIIKKSSSATKLNIDAQETPQTINVVTRQQMDDFNITDTRETLRNTPGIYVANQETERSTYMARGFEISNVLVDGVGFPAEGYNYQNTNPDTYLYDRVEVIKGADAITNAFGDPSATINMIRKRPTQQFQANGTISYGSWDKQRYEGDVSGSLTKDGRVRARVMGFEQTGDSYLDRYSQEKNGIAAIIDADLTDSTLLTIGGSQEKTLSNSVNWGALPLLNSAGQQLSYDRKYNYSPDWTYWDNTVTTAFAELTQKLGGDWKAKVTFTNKETKSDSKLLYLSGLPDSSDNTSGVYLWPSAFDGKYTQKQVDANVQGTFPLLGQRHEAVLGYSWTSYKTKEQSYPGAYPDHLTTDLASWTPDEPTWDYTTPTQNNSSDIYQKVHSLYGATRLHLNDDLKLLLGINYIQAISKGYNYGSTADYDKSKTSPYAGITYNITPEYTAYASYTSIFRPQTGQDENHQPLKPIEGKSYEVGVKSSWMDDQLTGTLAVFRTEESNYPLRSSDIITRTTPVSDLRSQGVEFGLAGKLTDNLDLSFGYTNFSLKDLKNGGHARTYSPSQMFNLLTTYTVPALPKLKLGVGVQWQDDVSLYNEDVNGLIKQKDYALVNLMASYDINKNISIQANGNNIGDKKYLYNFQDSQAFYGAPANYTVAVKFKY